MQPEFQLAMPTSNQPIKLVVLDNLWVDVDFVASPGGDVTVNVVNDPRGETRQIQTTAEGDKLSFSQPRAPHGRAEHRTSMTTDLAYSSKGDLFMGQERRRVTISNIPRIEIAVPMGCDIELQMTTGDIYINNVQGSLTAVECSGDIKANAAVNTLIVGGSGDVRLDRPTGTLARLEGKSGDLDVTHAQLAGLAITGGGSGDITVEGHIGQLVLNKSGSGDLKINGRIDGITGIDEESGRLDAAPRIKGSGDVELEAAMPTDITKSWLKQFKSGSGDLAVKNTTLERSDFWMSF